MTSASIKPEPADFDDLLGYERRRWRKQARNMLALLLIVGFCLWYGNAFEWEAYERGVPYVVEILIYEGLPPDFQLTSEPMRAWWEGTAERTFIEAVDRSVPWLLPLWDTLVMSIAGTAIAIVLSFFVAFAAATNTTPHWTVYWVARGILNTTRAIPELIMGIIFLIAVGPGILPGILALSLHSVGMVAKFFAESIEHVDPAPIEAARAAGAGELQVLWHAVLPQVLPQFSDVAFYRWEYNFRASTVLGLVGCGGIGLMIQSSISLMDYGETTALLILVLLGVTIVDSLSSVMRKRFR